MKRSIIFVCKLVVLLNILGCSSNEFGTTNKLPIDLGKINIAKYDLVNEPPLILAGEWELYWGQLLSPADFELNPSLQPDTIISFPSYWNSLKLQGKEFGGYGYATYRLRIENIPINVPLAIKMRNAMTSYKLWVNGELLLENGMVGTSLENTKPGFLPDIQSFSLNDGSLYITLQISNFSHAKGGMRGDVILGGINKVFEIREKNIVLDVFLIGSILIMGFYHLGLYFLLRKNTSTLFFGLLCVAVAIRISCTGEIVINNFMPLTWEMLQKLEFITYVSVFPAFLLFVKALYPKSTSTGLVNALVILTALLLIFIIASPSAVYSHIANPYQIVIVLGGIYVFYILYKTIKRDKKNLNQSYIFLAGYGFLFIAVIYDVFYYHFLAQKGYLAPVGLFGFIICQSFLLSNRFSAAFKLVEVYSTSLEKKVKERTLELEHKNENLEQLNKEKDGIIDIVAHDLKSPFNNILGFSELLKLTGKLDKEQKEYVQQIEHMIGTGKNLIRDILDMHAYDYEDFKLNYTNINFSEFITEWQKRYVQLLSKKNQTLIVEITPNIVLVSDKDVITRIIDNLMTNAIKFSEKDKTIWINATISSKNKVEIVVKDEGQGLTEEDQKMMFKPFHKLSAKPTAGESSNGLGLSIIKSLVQKLSGEISMESTKGVGASFRIILPLTYEVV